jgi:hypothetical protein
MTDVPGFAQRVDGVASRAMLALLDRLHSLAKAGKAVDVVAFDRARDQAQARRWQALPGQGPREAAQAENIATAAAAKPYDRVLVLTGNGHARKLVEDRSDIPYEPMAMRLARSGTLVSLRQRFGTGTEWSCLLLSSQAPPACGEHGTIRAVPPQPMRVALWSANDPDADMAYDGYYWFPVVHASRPAGAGAVGK